MRYEPDFRRRVPPACAAALACLLLTTGVIRAAAQEAVPPGHPPLTTARSYVPHRVYDSEERRFSDFEVMLAQLSTADVVLVGEQHDDVSTHVLELAVLEGLARRQMRVVVSMEMFERDAQGVLDDYLAGRVGEQEFLQASRPWPRYASDYRPIVEFARAKGWPVIAANVPRKHAADVGKAGIGALDALAPDERALAAAEIQCPKDEYFELFAAEMLAHPSPHGGGKQKLSDADRALVERFYVSQCLKDETMAESIARAYQALRTPRSVIVHYTGAFHAEYGLGTAARVMRRLPEATTRVVSFVPLERPSHGDALDIVEPKLYRDRAEFVVFTLRPVHGPR